MTDGRDPPGDPASESLASEFALGLLDSDDRAAAKRRMLGDRAFAAEVERWRSLLGPLFEGWPDEEAPAGLFARVEASIAGTTAAPARRWGWPVVSAVLGVAAAVLLLMLVARPAPRIAAPPPPAPLLAASIQPTRPGAAPIVALYDPARAAIRIGADPVADPSHSAELWVIAGKAPPQPIGLLHGPASSLALAIPVRAVVAAGATLAISREPAGGSPTGLPTGPVIATGVLRPV